MQKEALRSITCLTHRLTGIWHDLYAKIVHEMFAYSIQIISSFVKQCIMASYTPQSFLLQQPLLLWQEGKCEEISIF